MNAEIELYKGSRSAYFGSLSISMLLIEALKEEVANASSGASSWLGIQRSKIVLHFHDMADIESTAVPRLLSELNDDLGWLHVQFIVNGRKVYDGSYGFGELLGSALATTLKRIDPAERIWAFAFRNLTEGTDLRPAPDVVGTVEVDLREEGRPLPFTVQPVEVPAQRGIDVAELGIDPAALGPVSVLITSEVHDLMLERLPLSERIEEGGFFLGRIRHVANNQNRHVAQVTHVGPAARAGASAIHFTFTPDSFQEVNKLLTERDRGEELVGWYHTHLFPPSADIGTESGLSGIDIDTHLSTFRRTGQVAGLINLFSHRRVLRFYSKVNEVLQECPLWIGDERGRYRAASSQLGRG